MLTGIVIPYFQREPGILSAALGSVFAQQTCSAIRVVVVDDASPSPAELELVGLPPEHRAHVQVIVQANGGPGAARNTALDHLGSDVDLVAFLDSDDQWTADHLESGIRALDHGYDVYFSNLLDFDSPIDYFRRRGGLWRADHVALDSESRTFGFAGSMTSQILAANFIQLSTVIFRRAVAPALRFRTDFRRAGEDMLFWLQLSQATNRFCYSTAVEVQYGRGVNIYRSAATGSHAAFERLRDETRFRRALLHEFAREPQDRKNASRALRHVRKDFAAELLHRVRRTRPISLNDITKQWELDPWSIISLPSNCTRCALDWLASHSRQATGTTP